MPNHHHHHHHHHPPPASTECSSLTCACTQSGQAILTQFDSGLGQRAVEALAASGVEVRAVGRAIRRYGCAALRLYGCAAVHPVCLTPQVRTGVRVVEIRQDKVWRRTRQYVRPL
jgi:hypothetical protein